MLNPYSVSADLTPSAGIFCIDGKRAEKGFLYRVIDLNEPVCGRFVYNGWWFTQTISFAGQLSWRKISWLRIHKVADFFLSDGGQERKCRLEIVFSRMLRIKRFSIWVDEMLVYDEVC